MADISEVMKAFSSPPRESLLKGDDAVREQAFQEMIARGNGVRSARREPDPLALPARVPLSELKASK